MIKIEDPLNDRNFRVFYWFIAIVAFVGIFGMIPPRDGADVLVSILCGLICYGTIWQLADWYRKEKKNGKA